MALLSATDYWYRNIDEGKVVGSLLIDFSKAFDSVNHSLLLQDLNDIGCSLSVTNWFSDYLSKRMQRVVSKEAVTEWKTVERGVPQGSCLSPLLFNIFVRKLPSVCSSASHQFADDLTTSDADKDVIALNDRITHNFLAIQSFCMDKKLQINTDKTQLIYFKTPSKKLSEKSAVYLNGIEIKPLESVKLLGVHVDRILCLV